MRRPRPWRSWPPGGTFLASKHDLHLALAAGTYPVASCWPCSTAPATTRSAPKARHAVRTAVCRSGYARRNCPNQRHRRCLLKKRPFFPRGTRDGDMYGPVPPSSMSIRQRRVSRSSADARHGSRHGCHPAGVKARSRLRRCGHVPLALFLEGAFEDARLGQAPTSTTTRRSV